MRIRAVLPLAGALLAVSLSVAAAGLESLSNRDAAAGLKDALSQSAAKAVAQLGATDGFLGNPKVKIPLPESIHRVERGLRRFGMGEQADELVTRMNRAAEMAAKEAKPILVDAVRRMTLADAKNILTGGDTAATDFFRRTTSVSLAQRFLPIVRKMTAKVRLAEHYDSVAGPASSLGLIDEREAHLDQYVTQKALDGLFLVIGEKEKEIRHDPVGAATGLARRVFGMLVR